MCNHPVIKFHLEDEGRRLGQSSGWRTELGLGLGLGCPSHESGRLVRASEPAPGSDAKLGEENVRHASPLPEIAE